MKARVRAVPTTLASGSSARGPLMKALVSPIRCRVAAAVAALTSAKAARVSASTRGYSAQPRVAPRGLTQKPRPRPPWFHLLPSLCSIPLTRRDLLPATFAHSGQEGSPRLAHAVPRQQSSHQVALYRQEEDDDRCRQEETPQG